MYFCQSFPENKKGTPAMAGFHQTVQNKLPLKHSQWYPDDISLVSSSTQQLLQSGVHIINEVKG